METIINIAMLVLLSEDLVADSSLDEIAGSGCTTTQQRSGWSESSGICIASAELAMALTL